MSCQDRPSPDPEQSTGPDRGDLEFPNERPRIDAAVKAILDALVRHRYSESSRFAVRLALEEGISNAFRHGHSGLPASSTLRLSFQATAAELRVTIRDRGPGFDPAAVPDPTLEQNLEIPSGRGLMLMRAYMTSVSFNPAGNEVTMLYRKPIIEALKSGPST
jgi:serine/threonine-protein kinase RsbW